MIATLPTATAPVAAFSVPFNGSVDAQMEGALVGVVQYANVMQTVRAMDWSAPLVSVAELSAPAVSVADFSAPAWGARGEYDQ